MAVRITLECGHAAMLRTHKTPEGYTHDWEVFVRGVDHADIHYYIEKVVFNLHETFPKPKRTLKEPPYAVKESGYAGFVIPIDIYLKNKDEPKKLQIMYDLQLQPSGPAINNVMRHTEVINNPSEEFRRKLLKGGAVAMSSSESGQEKGESKSSTMVGKPKLSGGDSKKHRFTEPKTSNHFAYLFGDPIKTVKISPDNKKAVQSDKSSTSKPLTATDKGDKTDKNAKTKDSPHKDKKDKVDEKKEKKVKDQSRERNRSKDKSKRSSSPGSKSHTSPSAKRPSSPVVVKKSSSPVTAVKRSASPKPKEKDAKRPCLDKDKDKDKEKEKERDKSKDTSKNSLDSSKSEKKKEKKHKEDREKDRKDKYKERERTTAKETPKVSEKRSEKVDKSEKPEKEKEKEKEKSQESRSKDARKSPKPPKECEKSKDDKAQKVEKQEKLEKTEKAQDGKGDKDRQKHKHKKKEKKDKRDSSREREKKEKRDKSKSSSEKQSSAHNVPQPNPLTTLLAEIPERDSSDSTPSVDDDSFLEPKPVSKKDSDEAPLPTMDPPKPLSPTIPMHDLKKEKSDKSGKRDKPKSSRSEERESRKRKRRSESKCDEDRPIVKKEKERDPSNSPLLEPVSSSQSPVAVDNEIVLPTKEKEDRGAEQTKRETEAEQVAPDSTNSTLAETEHLAEPRVFSEDYVSQLRDLQHKIMTLQDNQELQRVVQVIAETGQYEITKKTFDFDLCALDRRTVQRLQQFFSAS